MGFTYGINMIGQGHLPKTYFPTSRLSDEFAICSLLFTLRGSAPQPPLKWSAFGLLVH